jgi:hypothetical protein
MLKRLLKAINPNTFIHVRMKRYLLYNYKYDLWYCGPKANTTGGQWLTGKDKAQAYQFRNHEDATLFKDYLQAYTFRGWVVFVSNEHDQRMTLRYPFYRKHYYLTIK